MTRARVAGRRGGSASPSPAVLIPLILSVMVLGTACGNGNPPTAALPSPVTASAPPASPVGSGETGAKPTAWPGNAVLGIEALGVADGPILAAINDFNRGIATEDLALMRRAANGLAGLDVLLPNLEKISIYEPMRPFADRYGAAIREIVAAAKAVRAAIDAGDAGAITTSSQALIASLSSYTDVQPELATWVGESIKQRRLLVR